MLLFQSMAFELVGLVLSLLLESTSTGGQFVLLLSALAPRVERHFTHWSKVRDVLVQLLQLFADGGKLLGICCQIVAIATTSLATMLNALRWKDIVKENKIVKSVMISPGAGHRH